MGIRMLGLALALLAVSSTRADAEVMHWLVSPVIGVRLGARPGLSTDGMRHRGAARGAPRGVVSLDRLAEPDGSQQSNVGLPPLTTASVAIVVSGDDVWVLARGGAARGVSADHDIVDG
jgi:hypothetical protein